MLLEKNRAIACYTKALEFRNGKSFRRVTEEGYAGGGWAASAIFKLKSARLPIDNIPYAFSDDDESRERIMAIAHSRAETYYGQLFSEIIYIGDGVWDIRLAKKLGYSFIGIASDYEAKALFKEGATNIFPNYDDYESFLIALSKN